MITVAEASHESGSRRGKVLRKIESSSVECVGMRVGICSASLTPTKTRDTHGNDTVSWSQHGKCHTILLVLAMAQVAKVVEVLC